MTHDMWVVVLLVLPMTAVALMAVQCFCVNLCYTYCSKGLCSAADCPDYRITVLADCTPYKSGESSNTFSGNEDLYHSNPPCG